MTDDNGFPTAPARRWAMKILGAAGAGFAGGLFSAPVTLGADWEPVDLLQRPIPVSGEKVPAVGLGTARTFSLDGLSMSGRRGSVAAADPLPETLSELRNVLRLFHAHGGRVVDSSPMYGTAEELVGDFARELGIENELFMSTKVWADGREPGIAQMTESMELLHSKPLDVMLIHNLRDWRTHYRTLRRWQEEGHIRYIGISHSRTGAHDEVERVLKAERFDIFQINYNILDTNADKRLFPLARDKGLAVEINEPFASGDLFRRVKGIELPAWATDFDADTWAQFFLKFILGHPAVTCALPATGDPEHVVDNTLAMAGGLPDAGQRRRMVDTMLAL